MTRKLDGLSRGYQTALRTHLRRGPRARPDSARRLGRQALAAGVHTLDLAKLHEQTLVAELLPHCPARKRVALIKQAGIFFAAAISPIITTRHSVQDAIDRLEGFIGMLSQRAVELAASNQELKQVISQHKTAEATLRKSEHRYSQLLEQSDDLHGQLRRLSHQMLSAQEEERKKISHELHDVIAQTLTGLNLRLANLKQNPAVNTHGLNGTIAETQRLVEKSVDIIHRYARELRPMVLDDLGLIPALHSFITEFRKRTGIHIHFTSYTSGRIKQLNNATRTVLYRVAQEALTNVARHAHASRVDVTVQKLPRAVLLTIQDNGKSFQVKRVLRAKTNKRLGLLGMRERTEMVGGSFVVESVPGAGTTIRAKIPFSNTNRVSRSWNASPSAKPMRSRSASRTLPAQKIF